MEENNLTVAVETMASPYAGPGLDCVAASLSSVGYRVIRWHGPYARRFKFVASAIPKSDAAVIWNGLKPRYRTPVKTLRQRKIPFLVMEVGWHPQKGTYQIDAEGINTGASWVQAHLSRKFSQNSSVALNEAGTDLLVVMQNDGDSQITHYSPNFTGMLEFLTFLLEASRLPLRVRFHPRHPPGLGLKRLIRRNQSKLSIDRSKNFLEALNGAIAVACINSSAGVEALEHQFPVLCFGQSIYRVPKAVYCLDDDVDEVNRVTRDLSERHCDLDQGVINEVVSTIKLHQLVLDDLPKHVPEMIETFFSDRVGLPD